MNNNVSAMIESVRPRIKALAIRFRRPANVEAEDLESEAMLAIVRVTDQYDPDRGASFATWALTIARHAMSNYCQRSARHTGISLSTFGDEESETNGFDPPDIRGDNPAAMAELHEPGSRYHSLKLDDARQATPPFAEKVGRLRLAMFDAISESDVQEITEKLVERSKSGDLAAMKLLMQFLVGSQSGLRQTVNLQQVVVKQGDE